MSDPHELFEITDFRDAIGEGVNGNHYAEGLEFSGEYDSLRKQSTFVKNPLYYFRRLFGPDENHRTLHETKKAVLFEVDEGRFWVPKALLREDRTFVHQSFRRSYLEDQALTKAWIASGLEQRLSEKTEEMNMSNMPFETRADIRAQREKADRELAERKLEKAIAALKHARSVFESIVRREEDERWWFHSPVKTTCSQVEQWLQIVLIELESPPNKTAEVQVQKEGSKNVE